MEKDTLYGGDGKDTLYGEAGDDSIWAGDDTLLVELEMMLQMVDQEQILSTQVMVMTTAITFEQAR